MTSFVLRGEDIARFATASGDVNPLHVDDAYARRTSFGRPIAHGILSTVAALSAVPAGVLASAGRLAVRFPRPILDGVTYRVAAETKDDGSVLVVAREGDMPVLTVGLMPGRPLARAGTPVDRVLPPAPEVGRLDDWEAGVRFAGEYAVASLDALRELAARLGGSAIPPSVLGALAWSSWFVGMRCPGRDALFSSLTIELAEPAPPGGSPADYTATIRSVDTRTGTLVIDAVCGGLSMEIRACLRSPVPRPTWESATSSLPRSERLAGSSVLVVGGGRGLGGAITSVLAAQGATVWATQRTPGAVEELQRTFGDDRVRPLLLDAADPEVVRHAAGALDAAGVKLDGLVLNAGPAVRPLTVHPDNVAAIAEFVNSSLLTALTPLAAAAERMAPGGWLTVISSSAVEDTPEQWPHYSVAKAAVEMLGTYCARRRGLRVLVARPPKMWTDMSNGPLGRIGAIPTEQVASAIAEWVIDGDTGAGVTLLGSAGLRGWSAARSR
ncbi:SDR family NAD(P)-dependent oxidoreductase [Nonomuraea sp. NPDC050663]|uniref:SDR family NAD(P)-dependent oxidoreductase n=1 Tax=Nonomuraea sp. NPDC050663 TaxID=3364370 RepID=UPI0037B50062